ncbi:MAG: cation transporter [Enterocloster asparagiformis]|nr:cation transporter [Enterocloster asparagiformis]
MTNNMKPVEIDKDFTNKAIRKMSVIGIAGNVILASFKLFAGVIGHSGAMVSDAVHSFSDVFATFIAFLGVKISQKENDSAHQYGHERMECIASLLLGLILFVTGVMIGKNGIANILSGSYRAQAIPGTIALVAAVISIVMKEAMYWYTRYYAKLLNSPAFMADAWHHRSDAFSSVGSMIGVAGAMMGFPVMDSIASVIICLFILKVAVDIVRDSLQKMMDTSCGKEYEEKLSALILSNKDIRGIDLLHTRQFGSKVYVDLEIAVDGDKSLREAHAVAEEIHNCVEQNFSDVKHIMIHVNPAAEA